MEFLTNLDFGYWAGIVALLVIVGERVAALTENKTDDMIFGWVHKILVMTGVRFPDVKPPEDAAGR